MKNLMFSVIIGLLMVDVAVNAQDCTYYFPVKVGATREMKSYDKKDKLVSIVNSKIIENKAGIVKVESEVTNEKGKSLGKSELEVKCENGEFVVDMKSYLNNVDLEKYKGMDVKVDAKNMTIPGKLQPGQKLNDGEITIKISTNGFTILNMNVKITNRTVVGYEDITTPAGTFKCAKITSDMDGKMVVKIKSKVTEWLSEKVGVVRSESKDDDGKMSSYSVLTAVSQ